MDSSRRMFIKGGLSLAAAAAVLADGPMGCAQQAPTTSASGTPSVAGLLEGALPTTRKGDMLYRKFGKTNEEISLVGLGGAHAGRGNSDAATRLMRSAIDRGINFFDNCWDYGNGQAETLMGAALRDGYRNKVFLMTKFDGRTKGNTAKQIDESLKRLQTDHVDLMQFHENIRMDDPDRFFATGGAMEAVVEAKKAGKVRYIGFTGHKDPAMHLRMLELARQHDFHFDSVQMPINVLDAHYRSFAAEVIPVALKDGLAVLAMKTMAGGALARTNYVTPIQCLHYAMNMPCSTVIAGMDNMDRLDQAIEAVKTFKPWTKEELAAVLDKTRTAAATGSEERFKTSNVYDGTSRNPAWMG